MLGFIQLMFTTRIGEVSEIGHIICLTLNKIHVPIPRLYFRLVNFLFL